jgi:mannose-6-phosphate isomerase-like protein (cupin superfamily)
VKQPISALQAARSLSELWSPRVIAELDDSYVKVAKLEGQLGWHSHAEEDELFLVLSGRLRIEMEDREVTLGPGDCFAVPQGVRHNPVADPDTCVLLVEKRTDLHTGSEIGERTRSLESQLRPL